MDEERKGNLNHQFAKGSALASFALAAGYLIQYVFQLSVSRILNADQAGTLFVAFAFALLVSIVTRLGMDKTGLKVVAGYFAESNRPAIREVALLLSFLVGLVSILFVLVMFLGSAPLREFFPAPFDDFSVSVIYLSIPLVAVCFALSEVLRGMRLVGLSSLVQLVAPYGIATVCIWGAFYVVGSDPKIGAFAFFCGFIFSVFLGFYFILKATAGCVSPLLSHYPEVLKGAPSMLWSSIILFGIASGDVVILGYFVPSEEIAYYFAASRTAMLISVGMVGTNSIVVPMIAAAHKQGNTSELGYVARMGARLSLAAAVFLAGFLFIGGELILSLFGKEYEESFQLLLILLAGQLVNAAVGAVAFIMFMSGQERNAAKILTVVILAMLILYVLIIPILGIMGAALVTALGIAVWNISMMTTIQRRLAVVTRADNLFRCVAFLSGVALTAFLYRNIGGALGYVLVLYGLAAPFAIWKFVLLREDRAAILSVVKRSKPNGAA